MQQRPPPGAPRRGPPGASNRDQRLPPQQEDVRFLAMVVHILPIVTSVLGPMYMLSMHADRHPFVRYHATQALWMSAITLGAVVLSCGTLLSVVWIPWIYNLYVGLQARDGEWTGYIGIDKKGLPALP